MADNRPVTREQYAELLDFRAITHRVVNEILTPLKGRPVREVHDVVGHWRELRRQIKSLDDQPSLIDFAGQMTAHKLKWSHKATQSAERAADLLDSLHAEGVAGCEDSTLWDQMRAAADLVAEHLPGRELLAGE